jgi:hypothetical protein
MVEPFIMALEKGDGIVKWDAVHALRRIGTVDALTAVGEYEARLKRQSRARKLYASALLAGIVLAVALAVLVWVLS